MSDERECLVDAEELAALRQEVAQVAEDLLQGRQEEPPETPRGPFRALRRILGFIGVRKDR